MFKIPQIEKSQVYIDRAMGAMQEYASKEKPKIDQRFKNTVSTQRKEKDDVNLNKRKDLELQKIRFLNDRVNQSVRKITKAFPNFLKVDEIYIKLINTAPVNVAMIKDHLSILNWIGDACDEFTQKSEFKIKRAKTQETIGFLMKKHLGRVNSLFSKNKKIFQSLEEARKFLNKLPTFEDLYTTAIAGYPNVGKSTLLKNMTGSNVEIQNYPFTTKGLMFSYLNYNNSKAIQVIDTPGLLGREINNDIEERASIVITNYCQDIVFVLDFTQSCGYTIEEQVKLFKKTSNLKKEIYIYLSKTDLYDEETEERFEENLNKIKKFKLYRNFEKLKEDMIQNYLNKKEKFDPSKLKLIK